MNACLDAIRKYFDTRNEVWLDGHPDALRGFLADVRHKAVDSVVTHAVSCKKRSMSARKTPLLRAHTKIRVTPMPGGPNVVESERADSKQVQTYLICENVTWVYQDGMDYRVEARVIWHRQRWQYAGREWKLLDAWESDETNLAPGSFTEIAHREVPLASVPEQSKKCVEYDRFRAFRYAELWWNGSNPGFPQMRDDCTNFVSQCLFAGHVPMDKRSSRAEGWWMEIGSTTPSEKWSYSWAVTEALRRYLVGQLGAKRIQHPDELKIGDVIVYDWNGTGQVHHAVIVTDFDDRGEPLVNAHTDASYHRHYRYLDSPAWTSQTRYEFLHLPNRLC